MRRSQAERLADQTDLGPGEAPGAQARLRPRVSRPSRRLAGTQVGLRTAAEAARTRPRPGLRSAGAGRNRRDGCIHHRRQDPALQDHAARGRPQVLPGLRRGAAIPPRRAAAFPGGVRRLARAEGQDRCCAHDAAERARGARQALVRRGGLGIPFRARFDQAALAPAAVFAPDFWRLLREHVFLVLVSLAAAALSRAFRSASPRPSCARSRSRCSRSPAWCRPFRRSRCSRS